MLDKLSTNYHWQKKEQRSKHSASIQILKTTSNFTLSEILVQSNLSYFSGADQWNYRVWIAVSLTWYEIKLIKAVPFSIGTDSGVHYVKTMLVRFCDGLRHISNDLRSLWDGLRRFLTILAIRWNKQWAKIIFYCPATKPCLTVKNRQ